MITNEKGQGQREQMLEFISRKMVANCSSDCLHVQGVSQREPGLSTPIPGAAFLSRFFYQQPEKILKQRVWGRRNPPFL